MTEPLTLAQANAPEKLWLSAPDIDNEHDVWFDPDEGGTEYVRADIAEHMRTELSNRTMAFGVIHSEWKQEKAAREAAEAKLAKVETERDALARKVGSFRNDGLVQAAIARQGALQEERDDAVNDTLASEAELSLIRKDRDRLSAELAEARKHLEWYGENARLARLIHSEGDAGRHALAADGGKRARSFLASKEAPHD